MSLRDNTNRMTYPIAFSLSSSSSPPLTTRHTNSKSNKNNEIDWLDIAVELTLRLGIAVASGYILMWMTRKLFPQLTSNGDETSSSYPKTTTMKRLSKILENRYQNDQITSSSSELSSTKSLSKSKTSIRDQTQQHHDDRIRTILSSLSSYEIQIAEDIIDPADVDVNFTDIGGIDHIKQEIYELVVMPLIRPDYFVNSNRSNKLIQSCKGILLYGKPGTGKTMLAKALASESNSIFIPLQLSKILNKYWGESNKLINATFKLAYKLQPSIIFIDELDTFLKNSGGSSNDSSSYMDSIKAEFLTLWDGLNNTTTSNDHNNYSRVMVLGATNKPHHIDSAILRRMPRAFEIPLPNYNGRLQILQLLLSHNKTDTKIIITKHNDNDDNDEHKDTNATTNNIQQEVESDQLLSHDDLSTVATMSEGYSGSDLKELCQAAAMVAIRERTSEYSRRKVMGEVIPIKDSNNNSTIDELDLPIRPISFNDFIIAFDKVKRTGEAAYDYGNKLNKEERQTRSPSSSQVDSIRQMVNLISTLTNNPEPDEEKGDDDDDNHDDDDIPNIR